MKASKYPEQRPLNIGGVIETREEFEKKLRETMLSIAVDAYNDWLDKKKYLETLGRAHERFFNGMKGGTNIHRVDVDELVDAEIKRQTSLYEHINTLDQHFHEVQSINPTSILAYPHWDYGLSCGCNININGTRFFAVPRVPCSTDHYITVKQAPTPANIIQVNEDMILMLPYREDLSKETREQLTKYLGHPGQITEEEIEEPIHVQGNYLRAHSKKEIDEGIIKRVMEKYGVDGFMVGYPDRNLAIIYTGLEESIERLWKTVYFQWGEMWRRYS